MGRVTVDGAQTQFSCKITIDPKVWDAKGGCATGRSAASVEANRVLGNMPVSINRHYREIMDSDKSESLIIKEFGLRFCAILSFTGQQ